LQLAFEFFHFYVVDGFAYRRDEYEYGIEPGYLDKFDHHGVQFASDDEGAVVFPKAVGCQNGTKATGVDKFDIGKIEDEIANTFLVEKDKIAFQAWGYGGIEVFLFQRQKAVGVLFIDVIFHSSLIFRY